MLIKISIARNQLNPSTSSPALQFIGKPHLRGLVDTDQSTILLMLQHLKMVLLQVAWSATSHYGGGYEKAYLQFFNKFGDTAVKNIPFLDNHALYNFSDIQPTFFGPTAEELGVNIYLRNVYDYEEIRVLMPLIWFPIIYSLAILRLANQRQ